LCKKPPPLITPGAFAFYAGLCLLGWVFCLFCFPETAGLSLEEVQMVFRDGFGIKESRKVGENKKKLTRVKQNSETKESA
jgi:MFS transporter, SP family, solute carrier family 2 (myo-inositol transporter), member 13